MVVLTIWLSEKPLVLKAPATIGAFYFFNQHHKPLNQPLITGTIERS